MEGSSTDPQTWYVLCEENAIENYYSGTSNPQKREQNFKMENGYDNVKMKMMIFSRMI